MYEEPQIIADAESANILFTNWTTVDFVGRWNKQDRTIKKGQSILLPKYLARHYSHQLAIDAMNNEEIDLVNRDKYEEYFNKCMSSEEEEETKEDADIARLNKEVPQKVAKEAPKKTAKKNEEEINEDFPDETT